MNKIEFYRLIKGNKRINQYRVTVPLVYIRELDLKHKRPIKITLHKNNNATTFITTVNFTKKNGNLKRAIFYINRYARQLLHLDYNDKILVSIEKPIFEKNRPRESFKDNKLDLLASVPNNMLVSKNGNRIILWRPKSRSLEINRYVDIKTAGYFFGLSFSEGQKCVNTTGAYVSICNKDINLHKYLIEFLKQLGVYNIIKVYCYYNPRKTNVDKIKTLIDNFKGIYENPIRLVKADREGDYVFLTNVNSTLLGELILNAQDNISNFKNKIFLESFIAKELSGDGSLNVTKRSINIIVGEKDSKRRLVLKKIIDEFGFVGKINDERMTLSFDATSAKKRLYLIRINAFDSKNHKKLVYSIANSHSEIFQLQIKRLKELRHLEEFKNETLRDIFGWTPNKATKWLIAMKNKGFIQVSRKRGKAVFYKINKLDIIKDYANWERKYNLLNEFKPQTSLEQK